MHLRRTKCRVIEEDILITIVQREEGLILIDEGAAGSLVALDTQDDRDVKIEGGKRIFLICFGNNKVGRLWFSGNSYMSFSWSICYLNYKIVSALMLTLT